MIHHPGLGLVQGVFRLLQGLLAGGKAGGGLGQDLVAVGLAGLAGGHQALGVGQVLFRLLDLLAQPLGFRFKAFYVALGALGFAAQVGDLVFQALDFALGLQAPGPGLADLLLGRGELDPHGLQLGLQAHDLLLGQQQAGAHRVAFAGEFLDLVGEGLEVEAGQIQVQVADFVAQLLVHLGLFGLALQALHLGFQLHDDVALAVQVLLGGLHLAQADLFLVLVPGDAGRFLHPEAAFLGPGLDEGGHAALLDDGVVPVAQAGVHEELVDVLEPAGHLVDQVFALPGSVEPPGDLDFAQVGELGRGYVAFVLEGQAHLAHPGGRAVAGPVEDQVFHGPAAELAGGLFAQHPAHRVDHV